MSNTLCIFIIWFLLVWLDMNSSKLQTEPNMTKQLQNRTKPIDLARFNQFYSHPKFAVKTRCSSRTCDTRFSSRTCDARKQLNRRFYLPFKVSLPGSTKFTMKFPFFGIIINCKGKKMACVFTNSRFRV